MEYIKITSKIILLSIVTSIPQLVINATPTGLDLETPVAIEEATPGEHIILTVEKKKSVVEEDEYEEVCEGKTCKQSKKVGKAARASQPEHAVVNTQCPICLCECESSEEIVQTSPYCLVHKECFANYIKRKFVEESDEEGRSHPSCLNYADDATSEEDREMIEKYQNATPETMPKLKWFEIGGKKYFLEGSSLWRYEDTDIPNDGYLYARGWRRLNIPTCPRSEEPLYEFIEEFEI